ncbi:hypothetical protein ASPZODRAFT_58061 [Penicilliopsis zonata CBS 506.65]|uniref:Rho-GAP domain-containing protein n=1 Tax=Penicilliopsis zonata CBS 506.65 TaxID=1073090 RepID=A0A1L9SRY2_9EURO|nr:hypothetical protein ASPZODRAFT_58061 [Penicilliopsis zonata CBS 506.65]OJJ49884.1 hypothetical protein ASPZODRAFT_58061 [Penicilliopsis zonata CBS 506.65]
MDSPAALSESPMDQDDIPFPCKGCGEILEEGKAFELSGNRWHIDCFRCSTCGTLLDSDAHLLLLGDGSLICSNCTYSCSSCGNKIEDLAILTGDQAFCASCFRCRNCKRKIENLRYARTSQGIFCMDCHESLMQRRRKKKNPGASTTSSSSKKASPPNVKLDKSLPSLPPNIDKPQTPSRPDDETESQYTDTPGEIPERREVKKREEMNGSRKLTTTDTLILPSSTYRSNRHSMLQSRSLEADADGGGEFLIPLAFDPSEDPQSFRPPPRTSSDSRSRDYSSQSTKPAPKPSSSSKDAPNDYVSSATSSEAPSPHIAYQDKSQSRDRAADNDPASRWRSDASATNKASKSGSARSSRSDLHGAAIAAAAAAAASPESSRSENGTSSRPSHELRKLHENGSMDSSRSAVASPGGSSIGSGMQYPPKRGDSLQSKTHQIPRKEVASPTSAITLFPSGQDDVNGRSAGAGAAPTSAPTKPHGSPDTSLPLRDRSDSQPDPVKSGRIRQDSASTYRSDAQRAAAAAAAAGVVGLENTVSPALLRYSGGGAFSMDEDMARIMGYEDSQQAAAAGQTSESFLRRVSNSVRHARSLSDKGSRLSRDGKWPKSPVNGTAPVDHLGSPKTPVGISSPEQRDEIAWLRSELRKERQRVQEKEQKIAELEAMVNASAEVKQAQSELHEKRSTMVVLDAQKEIVMRELTVLTEHLDSEKRGGKNQLDLGRLTNQALREFVEAIQQLKDSYAPQIEELIQKRNQASEELANMNRMKDKSFQEFEQLSSKNAQLAELNNQLVHQIQELYKANDHQRSASTTTNTNTNGLGIYSHHSKEKSMTSIELLKPSINDLSTSISTANLQEEAEPATVLPGPQVVSIRKGQVRKFNWKKGGQNVAKGVTKGLKGAFGSSEAKDPTALPYGSVQTGQELNPNLPRSQTQDPSRQGFGFFGNQKSKQSSSTNKMAQNDGTVSESGQPGLFGTELEQRMEVEKSVVPAIVTRCIQEVELRGMDMEGIYRKSGASSVTQTIREGFEKSHLDYDISDPDLDIHAVTSTLKQYFRKLPTPLITFDVYEGVIESGEITSQQARIEALQKSLSELPRVHRDVLEFLMFHLTRVVEREKENLMTSQNVAVVFAPTIMRPETLAREMTDVQKKNDALKFMIENCSEIFMGIQE